MKVDAFDFELPEDLIALRPVSPRDAARMLVVDESGAVSDRHVRDLADLLRPGDALVFNDTRVIHARLYGIRRRADAVSHIEATLHMRSAGDQWWAFARPAKRLKPGDVIEFGDPNPACEGARLEADVIEKGEGGQILLKFAFSGPVLDDAIEQAGSMPLPPYIASHRDTDARDETDYQTVYAREPGAVAAPTAGLHFTPELAKSLKDRGISSHFVTLHVGAGTFLPVKADDTDDHKMHAEIGEIDQATADALNKVKADGGRIVSVGTTSLRLLESATGDDGIIRPFRDATSIFITPGYTFRAVDVLMTNFHLPKSTLFMLVSAFCGLETMQNAYAHAIKEKYRFYSYGDSSLLFRKV